MPLEFPRIEPNYVDRYRGNSLGLYSFRADSQVETRVATGCYGSGASFSLKFEGLDTMQVRKILKFWEEIWLDFSAGSSFYSFGIPESHPIWRKVHAIAAIEDHLLHATSLDKARWLLKDPGEIEVPLCGHHNWSCTIAETPDAFS